MKGRRWDRECCVGVWERRRALPKARRAWRPKRRKDTKVAWLTASSRLVVKTNEAMPRDDCSGVHLCLVSQRLES